MDDVLDENDGEQESPEIERDAENDRLGVCDDVQLGDRDRVLNEEDETEAEAEAVPECEEEPLPECDAEAEVGEQELDNVEDGVFVAEMDADADAVHDGEPEEDRDVVGADDDDHEYEGDADTVGVADAELVMDDIV